MENYNHLFSSTNPIEIDQIKMTLDNENISYRVIGEQALAAGNVELTGIGGASIQVLESKFIHAQHMLKELGYDTEIDHSLSKETNKFMILLTLAVLVIGCLLSYFMFF